MTRSKSLLLIFSVLLVAGIAATARHFLLGADRAKETVEFDQPAGEAREKTAQPDGANVAAPRESAHLDSTETLVAWPVQVEARLLTSGWMPAEKDVKPVGTGATARLSGRLMLGSAGAAGGLVFTAGPNQGRKLKTNAEGFFGASDLLPGLGIVKVSGPKLRGAVRQVRLRPGVDALLNLNFGRPTGVWLTVHDDKGEPAPDVKVRVDGQETLTDENGDAYFASMTNGRDIAVVLSKEGYATHSGFLGISLGYPVPKGKIQYRLTKACRLEVYVPSVGGKNKALVMVMPDNPMAQHSMSDFSLGGHPTNPLDFPWHSGGIKSVRPGTSAVFENLPQRRVAVRVFHEGASQEPKVSMLTLHPGRPTVLQVEMKPAPKLSGQVFAKGKPVADARIRLQAPDRTAATLQYFSQVQMFLESIPVPSLPVAEIEVVADRDGRFLLSSYPDLARARYLEAESPDGNLWAGMIVRDTDNTVTVNLKPRSESRATLELEFPGRIQALPVDLRVNGEPHTRKVLPASKNLNLADLTPGKWEIRARWNGRDLLDPAMVLDIKDEGHGLIPLPEGAIIGQDEETVRRARGTFD